MTTDTATPKEVAAALHMSEAALAQLRYRGTGPKFIRIGSRRVLYRWADVSSYLDRNTVQRTDEHGGDAA
ncbi:helix-turn-helix transcriptional regulator [Mycolicibacter arupensis]|uniref:DNA-binding protein n=1 Tax=Mycolicibacter arupensis TaxID=342002 RepID=A0A5C7XXM1_9MYCO|nr:DNA-binding protein [Mycolicibacter arupensis]TXI54295.1 MAG: DNA-binding protein [Mycolicibacter arupensis]